MGGKTSTSSQQVSIPPEVLARYNSVNAVAEQAAQTPFQSYTGQFVAPLTSTQEAGIANTNAAANQAQPYYQNATNTLMGAQQATSPYYEAATQALTSGMGQGAQGTQAAYGSLYGANAAARPLQQAGAYNMQQAYDTGQQYAAGANQNLFQAQNAGANFGNASYNSLAQAQQQGQGYTQAGYQQAQPYNQNANFYYNQGLGAAQPFNQGAANSYYGSQAAAQPLNQSAINSYYGAQSAAQPYNQNAASAYYGAQSAAQPLNQAAIGSYYGAQASAQPLQQLSAENISQAQQAAQPFNAGAAGLYNTGLNVGAGYNNAATQSVNNATQSAQPFNSTAANFYGQGVNAAQPYNAMSGQSITDAVQGAQPFNAGAAGLYNTSLNVGGGYNNAANQSMNAAAQSAQPLNAGAQSLYNQGLGAAQPYNAMAGQGINNALQGAQPFNAGAANLYNTSLDVGAGYNNTANQSILSAAQGAQPFNASAANLYGQGMNAAQPYNALASQGINNAVRSAQPFNANAAGLYNQSLGAGSAYNNTANQEITGAVQGAQPFNAAAANLYGQAGNAAQPYNAMASQGLGAALNRAQPYNAMAEGLAGAGANAVNAQQIGGQQIGQFMSPYIQSVLQGTQGMLNQQNQQAMSGQLGNAIQAGAFGGDRAGIAAANLAQQQQLANAQTYSNILNQGYGQALSAAQQQQGVNLGAEQANRAAVQNAANQILGIGQQGYAQGTNTAQQQAALGQQLFGQASASGQNLAALGQQAYGQGLGAAQQRAALGQQVYGQTAGAGQNLAALGQQAYGQGLGAAQQQAALGQQIYGQATGTGQNFASLGQQQFGQGMTLAQQQAALGQQAYAQTAGAGQNLASLGQQQFGQGMTAAQQQAALAQQLFGQAATAGQNFASLGQQQFGQGMTAAQQQAAIGQQAYAQATGSGQSLASLGQQQFGQGMTAAQQQAALAQQQFGQGATMAQGLGALGQQVFGQGTTLGQNVGALGQQVFGQGQATAQGLGAMGQQVFGQGQTAGQNLQSLGQQTFGQNQTLGQNLQGLGQQQYAQGMGVGNQLFQQGATTAEQLAALGQQQFGQGLSAAQQQAAMGQQQYAQGMGLASGQNALAQQLFGQGATTSQQQAALAQQQYAQGLGASNQLSNLGQNIYNTGAQTSQQLAALGMGAQGANLAGAQAQLAAGQMQQQTNQAQNTALYNQFLQQQSYPFQVAQFLANIAEGTGALSGSTTTTAQPGGFFSDERLKENIKPIGKTNDGQTIYSYNYKGEPRTQIGLLAQEVEKKHPDAVGLAGGYKTVDYGKATHDAERQRRASGGGLVGAEDAYRGFADGGMPGFDPQMAQTMLAAQTGMFGPYLTAGGLGGGNPRVPSATLPVGHLMVASGSLPTQPSALENAKDVADLASSAKDTYDDFTKKKAKTPPNKNATGNSYDYTTAMDQTVGGGNAREDDPGGYAVGGMPYSDAGAPGLDIPDEQKSSPQLMTAQGKLDKPQTGMDYIKDNASTAMKMLAMGMARGGLAGSYADGGMPYAEGKLPSLDIPTEQKATPKLAVADAKLDKPRSGLDDAKDIAAIAATVMGMKRGGRIGKDEGGGIGGAFDDNETRYNDIIKNLLSGQSNNLSENNEKHPLNNDSFDINSLLNKINTSKNAQTYKNQSPSNFVNQDLSPPIHEGLSKYIAKVEGQGENPTSSARGMYQMTNPTFIEMYRKNFGDQAKGMSNNQILTLRNSPEGERLSQVLGPKLIQNNADMLRKNGISTTAGNVYLAHFLGPHGAVKLLKSHPDQDVSSIVSPEAILANKSILQGKSVRDVINWAHNKMQNAGASRYETFAKGGLAGAYSPDDESENQPPPFSSEIPGIPDPRVNNQPEISATQLPPPAATQLTPRAASAKVPPQTLTNEDVKLLKSAGSPGADNIGSTQSAYGLDAYGLAGANRPAIAYADTGFGPVANAVSNAANDFGNKAMGVFRKKTGEAMDVIRSKTGPGSMINGLAQSGADFGSDLMSGLGAGIKGYGQELREGKSNAWLPLLSGIAAMGTAPTRNLGVALASGVGAGAKTYENRLQAQRQFDINKQLTDVKTAQVRHEALQDLNATFNNNYLPGTNPSAPFINQYTGKNESWLEKQIRQNAFIKQNFDIMKGSPDRPAGSPSYSAFNTDIKTLIKEYGLPPGVSQEAVQALLAQDNSAASGTPATAPATPATAPATAPATPATATAPATPATAPAAVAPKTPPATATATGAGQSLAEQVKSNAFRMPPPPQPAGIDDPNFNPNSLRQQANALRNTLGPENAKMAEILENKAKDIESGKVLLPNGDTRYVDYGTQLAAYNAQVEAQSKLKTEASADVASIFDAGGLEKGLLLQNKLADIYKNADLNRFSPEFSDIIGKIASLPFVQKWMPEDLKKYEGSFDLATKITYEAAIQQAMTNGLNKAPATGIKTEQLTVPSPTMSADARYALIIDNKALIKQKLDWAKDWNSYKNSVQDVSKYNEAWNRLHPLEGYKERARNATPYFMGMSEEGKRSNLRNSKLSTPQDGEKKLLNGQLYIWRSALGHWVRSVG